MKKLFFAALLAVASIGGAKAVDLWASGSTSNTPTYICPGTGPSCNQFYNLPATTPVYSNKAPNQIRVGSLGDYQRPL